MLRGYWLLVIALGLVLASANHANAEGGKQKPQAEQSVAKSLGEIASANIQQAERAKRSDQDEAPCGQRQYGSSADLCAQWKAADAASDSAWWAWAGGVIGLGSLVGVFFAIGLAFHSNWIARDTAKRQLRAYVAVADYAISPDAEEPHKIRAIVTYQNVGETPAKDVAATLFVLAGTGAFNDASPRIEPPIDSAGGLAVMGKGSGKQTAITVDLGIPANIVLNGDYWVCAYGRITYKDIFGEAQETRYCAFVDPAVRAVGMAHADAPSGNSIT